VLSTSFGRVVVPGRGEVEEQRVGRVGWHESRGRSEGIRVKSIQGSASADTDSSKVAGHVVEFVDIVADAAITRRTLPRCIRSMRSAVPSAGSRR
jgi:hypothetical protein